MSDNKKEKAVRFDESTIIHQFDDTKETDIIILSREDDIKKRGKDHLVFDHDGTKVKLNDACVWYNSDGMYIQPSTYDKCDFCEICTIQ